MVSSSSAALQNAIQEIAQARKYVWDGPYDEVARWEAGALEAVGEAFGRGSAEFAGLSAAMQDRAWKDTNRPDASAPEVFVNNDFQRRMDRLGATLSGYLDKLQGMQQQAGAQEITPEAKVTAKKEAGPATRKKRAAKAKRKAPAAKKKKGGGRARVSAAAKARKGKKKPAGGKKKGGKMKRTATAR